MVLCVHVYARTKLAFLKVTPKQKLDNESVEAKNFNQQFDQLLDNAGSISQALELQIRQLEQKGVTKEQLQPLMFQKQIADFAASNPMAVQLLKPLIKVGYKKLVGLVTEL